ncbi:MAG: hypothetical protein Q9207_008040 [Kuettlingeria erythrocarpa]
MAQPQIYNRPDPLNHQTSWDKQLKDQKGMDFPDDQVHADAFGDFPVGSIVHKVQHGTDSSGDLKDSGFWENTTVGRRIDLIAKYRANNQVNGTVFLDAHKPSAEKAEDYVYLHSTGKTAPNGKPTVEDDEDDGLPDGWEARKTSGGKRYYVNHLEYTTQWSRPDSYSDYDMVEDSAELEPLPEGWEREMDRGERPYYVDQKTRSTTWQHPSFQVGEGIFSLPPGWERRRDHKQRIFYVDHNTRTTTWAHPMTAYNDDETRPLPEGWTRRRAKDDSKRIYYVDRDYNRTSYFFPDPIVHSSKQFIPVRANQCKTKTEA